jgi:hypothetical protein
MIVLIHLFLLPQAKREKKPIPTTEGKIAIRNVAVRKVIRERLSRNRT